MKSKKTTSGDLTEKQLSSQTLHQGKSFAFVSDRVLLPNQKEGIRDYVRYPEAVAIIPWINDHRLLLIRQFRYPVAKTIYEIPAGKIDDPQEDPLHAAKRELLEETGYTATDWQYLFSYYPCAAYSTEKIHIYSAKGLQSGEINFDEDEFIETEELDFSEALMMIQKGIVIDSKTIIALLYSQFHQKL